MNYIIDTDVGGDIDDALALIVACYSNENILGVTTTHIEPFEKARIAKLILSECGHSEIPVYAGIGCKRTDSNEVFHQQNPLFPKVFGYPNKANGEKVWYEKQAKAYKDSYREFDNLKIEKELAPAFISRIAKTYSKNNKLTIITLGPLHNIDAALQLDPSIKDKIKLYSMGGIYPKGYNWLISPEVTARVLSQVEVTVITNELITNNNLFITQDELKSIEDNIHSRFGRVVLSDWANWQKGDFFQKKNTFLYDPVTVYLAMHPEYIKDTTSLTIDFPCLDNEGKLKPDFENVSYITPGLENKIVKAHYDPLSQVNLIDTLNQPSSVRNAIIDHITKGLIKKDVPIYDSNNLNNFFPATFENKNIQIMLKQQSKERVDDYLGYETQKKP